MPAPQSCTLDQPRAGLCVLLVGDCERPEFAESVAGLRRDCARLVQAGDPVRAVAWLKENPQVSVDLILLVQSLPGQISLDQVSELRQSAPLARFWALLGSWCEGEARTGKPWPGVPRCYWYHWPTQWAHAQTQLSRGEPPIWSAAETLSADERLLKSAAAPTVTASGHVAVVAGDVESLDAIAEACRTLGFSATCWQVTANGLHAMPGDASALGKVRAIVWDSGSRAAPSTADVAAVRRQWPDAPLVGLQNFPRWQDFQQAPAVGVAAIIGKPYLLADLSFAIEQATRNADVAT